MALSGVLLAGEPGPKKTRELPVTDADRAHWAFQKPKRPVPPRVQNAGRLSNPVDAFILARLEKAGLQLASPADRATLLRRITFDLTGLPPSLAELQAFLGDARSDAYERVVDRLLASPHYGERWAQHWLDVVRYAESNGYEADGERPHAWRYRDYVIRAFNEDKPYDRFVTEQLAGDQLAERRKIEARGSKKQPKAKAEQKELASPSRSSDLLVASGFNRCGPVHLVSGNVDAEVNRQEVLTEMTGAVASTFLGLTVGCARCHNHKFDPLSQADYYRLQAFFAAAQPLDVDIASSEERAAYAAKVKAVQAKLLPLQEQVARLEAPFRKRITLAKKARLAAPQRQALAADPKKRTPTQRKLAAEAEMLIKISWDELLEVMPPADRRKRAAWRAQIHALEARLPAPPAHAWTLGDSRTIPPTFVLKRGDPKKKGSRVEPAFPRVLVEEPGKLEDRESRIDNRQKSNSLPDNNPAARSSILDRIALARWLTQPDHPLTARVMVNRIWQYHFGRGIVATPNDFGLRGEPPTHPELLDWLAQEFTSHNWSVKHIHRLIVLSATYRQAGRVADPRAKRLDPDNHWLWHMPRQRLQGEALRDSALAVAGSLHPRMGGPMVRVPLEPEVYDLIFTEGEPDGLWHVNPDPREHRRRSIYLFAKRNVRLPLLESFDKPDSLTSCPVRPVSTFAPQALILLNGPFMQEQSRQFAARLLRETGSKNNKGEKRARFSAPGGPASSLPAALIDRAYQLALARPPRSEERRMVLDFLASQTALHRDRLRARFPVSLPPDIPDDVEPGAAAAVVDFALALLNCNEFLYIH
jgi:hypothetical protein